MRLCAQPKAHWIISEARPELEFHVEAFAEPKAAVGHGGSIRRPRSRLQLGQFAPPAVNLDLLRLHLAVPVGAVKRTPTQSKPGGRQKKSGVS